MDLVTLYIGKRVPNSDRHIDIHSLVRYPEPGTIRWNGSNFMPDYGIDSLVNVVIIYYNSSIQV